ncbi:SusC/RagA family TonB-linked outer membrane protein [Longitalea luteola]|uniref:SusC/RagA family TonB-linked outer membrane protein n=1 Tax=Longitalea luteola TaxID=2812563 RepID=UPI001A9799B8|nr:SusC/RagA family TonB-linked outer membrane protein [Longitalea luteola]
MQSFAVGKGSATSMTMPKLHCSISRQLTRVMKISGIILLATSLHLSAKAVTQTVTLSEIDAPFLKVMHLIENQTGYAIFYNVSLISQAKKVTINVKNMPLIQALDLCFKDQPFTYVIRGNNITLKFRQEKKIREDPGVDVTGKITDKEGMPLVGANVKIKGTSKGAITNSDGSFLLKDVDDNSVLEISYVGFETAIVSLKGRKSLVIGLNPKSTFLDETVVIAYGTTSKRLTTGNVSSVKASDIEKQPVQNPLLTLQGRVPGVEVTQLTGLPGGGVNVRIQGQNSIESGLDPLIVIDGVPFPSRLAYGNYMEGTVQNGSPLNYVNPADIESIAVLKDADATAIYGSRAANGAILITTKKGKAGKGTLTFNMQQGWGNVSRKVDMMNTSQYLEMRKEAFHNSGQVPSANPSASGSSVYAPDIMFWDTTRYTDWQETLIGGTAQYTNVNARISGGTPSLQYLIGATYNRQTTVFPGRFDDNIGTLHFNLSGAPGNGKLRMQLSGSYSYDQNHLPGVDLTQSALLTEPNAPELFTSNGNLNWAQNATGRSTFINPLANANSTDYNNTTKNLIGNLTISYRLLEGLDLRTSFGYTNMQTNIFNPIRLEVNRPERRATSQRIAGFGNRNMSSWIIEPQINYQARAWRIKLDALVGTTIQKSSIDYLSLFGFGFPTDQLMKTLNAATSINADLSNSVTNRFNALFGRLNFNMDDKYILNLTGRRDGSNKFGGNNKFQNFGSVGVAWIMSEEKWFRKRFPFVSFGKVRSSFGITGNDQIPDFAYLSTYGISYSTILYQGNIGLNVEKIPNPNLQWEETKKWQTGIDFGILQDRIVVGATYSRNRSSNQLVQYVLPTFSGFSQIAQNLPATIENTIWEFTITSTNLRSKSFSWTTSANFSIPKNKLRSFPGIELTAHATGATGVVVGQPIGVSKVASFAGTNPVNGAYMIRDKNGNPVATAPQEEDRNVFISSLARYYGGLMNTFTYRRLQLEVLFQFVRKRGANDMVFYNGKRYPGEFSSGESNQPTAVRDRWQKPGDNTSKAPYLTAGFLSRVINSDAWYTYDASFVRLKNISLSWQVPDKLVKKLHLQNARLSCNGQNVATFTNYQGLDPETASVSILPPLRMLTIGVQIEF